MKQGQVIEVKSESGRTNLTEVKRPRAAHDSKEKKDKKDSK